MRNSYGYAKVRVFIDFWNFAVDWRDLTRELPEKNLNWSKFPSVIIEHLDEILPLRRIQKELRAVKVYASIKPTEYISSSDTSQQDVYLEEKRGEWFRNYLDQLTAYTVDITTQSQREMTCNFCNKDTGLFVEQGVDTKMAIDLVALASRDLFDIAVIITNDTDIIPSIKCVQDALDKQVVHIGVRGTSKNDVKNECWGHIFIEEMLADIA